MPVRVAVITTIQAPTASVATLVGHLERAGMALVAVGDRKTPVAAWTSRRELIGLEEQPGLGFALAVALPENHYSRKNLGYLCAIRQGAEAIFDTDDDNAPMDGWRPRERRCWAELLSVAGWHNVYSHFTPARIWPRGFPLEHLQRSLPVARDSLPLVEGESPVQQVLVNGSPDVDAIWRLLFDQDFHFEAGPSVSLAPGTWCPFNSQNTWWFEAAYPLLYLPSYASFRMTDIWRSFVAQRCLWELGSRVTFHSPDAIQDRNPHDLLTDMAQEVPGYLHNDKIRRCLESLDLSAAPDGVGSNLRSCYEALGRMGLMAREELSLVELWLRDLEALETHAHRNPRRGTS